ncbi:MAG: hypothetical protein RI900_264 [Actinomycetota bacterium]|jgi:spore germination protein GerM
MNTLIRGFLVAALVTSTVACSDEEQSSGSTGVATSTSSTSSTTTAAASTTSSTASTTVAPGSTTPVTTAPASTSPITTVPVPVAVPFAAYMVRDELLVPVRRQASAATPQAALAALFVGPTAAERAQGVLSLVPPTARLRSVSVSGATATVDVSSQFESGGGSLAMRLRVAQVVYTATQFPGVTDVRFEVDGNPVDMLSGEGIMVDPARRDQYTDGIIPAILLESPLLGDRFVQPIVIRGATNAFEATVNYQLVAPNGTVLLEGVTYATCGTGCWGVFEHQIESLPAGTKGPITLRVFDWSEADGVTMLDLVEFVLT